MFIDLCPGERIHVGEGVILTLLHIKGQQIVVTLEETLPVPVPVLEVFEEKHSRDPTPPLTCL